MKKIQPLKIQQYLCRGEAMNTFIEVWISSTSPVDAKVSFLKENGSYFTDDTNFTFKIKEVK